MRVFSSPDEEEEELLAAPHAVAVEVGPAVKPSAGGEAASAAGYVALCAHLQSPAVFFPLLPAVAAAAAAEAEAAGAALRARAWPLGPLSRRMLSRLSKIDPVMHARIPPSRAAHQTSHHILHACTRHPPLPAGSSTRRS